MRYKLIKEINEKYTPIQQILTNRGIPFNEIHHYLNTTDKDINDVKLLGEQQLKDAAAALVASVQNKEECVVIVDCDCDGYTSAAIMINYLYDLFPY
jgi:hypothetical protein